MKRKVLVICFNNLHIDARVMRQINFLKDAYDLTVVCFDAPEDPSYKLFRVKKTPLTFTRKAFSAFLLITRLYELAYRVLHDYEKAVEPLKATNFSIIIANDVEALPIAFKLAASNTKVFLDAHEYAPRQFEDRLYWRIFFQKFNIYLCKKYIPKVHRMSVINQGMVDAFRAEFAVEPIIINNATGYVDVKPVERTSFPIRLVHHGIFTLSRQPDLMIELIRQLDDRFVLDLIYLLPESSSEKTRAFFREFCNNAAATGRIRVLPALKNSEVVHFLNANYDMGLILVPPVNFNYQNGLPNKLFECIQGRLGMAVGPLHEIARVTRENQIGVVSDEFTPEAMASRLRDLTLSDINRFKSNAHLAARRLSSESNRELMLSTLRDL